MVDLLKAAKERAEDLARKAEEAAKRAAEGRMPGAPNASKAFEAVRGVAEGKADYLVSHKKGKEAETVYRGDIQKDGTVKFKPVAADELARQQEKGVTVQTFQQLKADLALQNTPAKIAAAADVFTRVDKRLLDEKTHPHNAALDDDWAALAQKGQKPAIIAGQVDTARTELVTQLKGQLAELEDRKNKFPELNKIAEGSNPPITLRESMKAGIKNALEDLKPAENLSNAVDGFNAQVANPPPPTAAPAAVPAKPAPSLGNF